MPDGKRDTGSDGIYKYKSWKKVIDKAYLYDYGGNEFAILRVHNAIRNYIIDSFDFVNTLQTYFFRIHTFSKGED